MNLAQAAHRRQEGLGESARRHQSRAVKAMASEGGDIPGDRDRNLSASRLFQRAATAGESAAALRREERFDRVSVPDQQHEDRRGIHPATGRRHDGGGRTGRTLSS